MQIINCKKSVEKKGEYLKIEAHEIVSARWLH